MFQLGKSEIWGSTRTPDAEMTVWLKGTAVAPEHWTIETFVFTSLWKGIAMACSLVRWDLKPWSIFWAAALALNHCLHLRPRFTSTEVNITFYIAIKRTTAFSHILKQHVKHITKACFYHFRNISKLRHILSFIDAEKVIHAFAQSHNFSHNCSSSRTQQPAFWLNLEHPFISLQFWQHCTCLISQILLITYKNTHWLALLTVRP